MLVEAAPPTTCLGCFPPRLRTEADDWSSASDGVKAGEAERLPRPVDAAGSTDAVIVLGGARKAGPEAEPLAVRSAV